jgi:hypothetical protein
VLTLSFPISALIGVLVIAKLTERTSLEDKADLREPDPIVMLLEAYPDNVTVPDPSSPLTESELSGLLVILHAPISDHCFLPQRSGYNQPNSS